MFQGYLVKPIKQTDLGPALQLAMERFRLDHPKAEESKDLRSVLLDGLEE